MRAVPAPFRAGRRHTIGIGEPILLQLSVFCAAVAGRLSPEVWGDVRPRCSSRCCWIGDRWRVCPVTRPLAPGCYPLVIPVLVAREVHHAHSPLSIAGVKPRHSGWYGFLAICAPCRVSASIELGHAGPRVVLGFQVELRRRCCCRKRSDVRVGGVYRHPRTRLAPAYPPIVRA